MVSQRESLQGIVPSWSSAVWFESVYRRCQCLIEPRLAWSFVFKYEPEWLDACLISHWLATADELWATHLPQPCINAFTDNPHQACG
jgi:hypothetical protein